MDQLRDYSDDRLITGCVYCGGPDETVDHVPARALLDVPFPENLPVVPACRTCNNGFSRDEEYVACLLEVVVAGSSDPARIRRKRVAKMLARSPALRSLIDAGKTEADGNSYYSVDANRVKNVILKLARGHAAFELSALCREDPTHLAWAPLIVMNAEEREVFEAPHIPRLFPEVGSRGLQRTVITQFVVKSVDGEASVINLLMNDWIEVQEGRYRYLAYETPETLNVKFVIGEYLACEVVWSQE
jgi:hypothetical protein